MDYEPLLKQFYDEIEAGKLPVIIAVSEGVCYYRSFRAASWSKVYSDDGHVRIVCTIQCCMYAAREAEEGEHRQADTSEA